MKDVSTDDVRIALELKKDADEKMVMAYLFKHTPLQTNFVVNLTCLIPTENPEVGRPERLDLHAILWHFLHFRLEVVTKRLEHELAALSKRIHILEGFEKVFDALDEILRIVRKSDGKADAAQKIMKRFELDADQTDAILELKIYRLARLEILDHPQGARGEAQARAADQRAAQGRGRPLGRRQASRSKRSRRSTATRAGPPSRQRRRARPSTPPKTSSSRRTTSCIVSRDGWVKRQKEVKDVSSTRVREGDAVLAVAARQHAADGGVLQQLRRRVYRRASSTCPRRPATASRFSGSSS